MEIFSGLLPFCVGNSPVTGEFPHKGQWHGALMFSLICAWTNSWVNYRDAGDLRRHLAYNDVIVMKRKDHLGDSLVIIGYFIGRKLSCSHSSDVTWATQRLKSLAPILFGQQLIETKNKEIPVPHIIGTVFSCYHIIMYHRENTDVAFDRDYSIYWKPYTSWGSQ